MQPPEEQRVYHDPGRRLPRGVQPNSSESAAQAGPMGRAVQSQPDSNRSNPFQQGTIGGHTGTATAVNGGMPFWAELAIMVEPLGLISDRS